MKDDHQSHHNNKKQHHNNSRFRSRKPSVHHNPNKVIDSNGPDTKVRGTASHIYDRYLTMARDSNSMGHYMIAENYLQHAEHYLRMLNNFSGLGTRHDVSEDEDALGVEEYDRFTDHRPVVLQTPPSPSPTHNVSVVDGYTPHSSHNRQHNPNTSFRRHNNHPNNSGEKSGHSVFNPASAERSNREHQHQPRRYPPVSGHKQHTPSGMKPTYSQNNPSLHSAENQEPTESIQNPVVQPSAFMPSENVSAPILSTPQVSVETSDNRLVSGQNRPVRRPRLRPSVSSSHEEASSVAIPSSEPRGPVFLSESSIPVATPVHTPENIPLQASFNEVDTTGDLEQRPLPVRRRTEQRWPRRRTGTEPTNTPEE